MNHPLSAINEITLMENLIDTKFIKYSGKGDAKAWLLQTMNQFKQYGLRRLEQFQAIPFLLEDTAYSWYTQNKQLIINFERFANLFLKQYSSTSSTIQNNIPVETVAPSIIAPNFLPTSHLQQTIVDEIIKKPTYFRGSKDDVHDWLEKLEQRFKMAKWNDEEKLQYISIHLQDDAYRWWTQTSTTIKSWSLFTEAVIKAFGSTRVQELAFEQLKWYKQTVNQSITQYYDKIIELCKKVDPAMADSLKLKYLMAGVKESLKFHIALYDPQTIETFLSYARKLEDTLSFTKTDYIIHQYNESQDVHTFQQSLSPIATPEGQHEHNEYKNVQYSQQELLDTKGENNSRYKNSFYSSQSRNSTPNKSSRICYTCGTPGHYSRDCTRHHFE
ncbi:unnamed protein product [Rotaria sp. Silwood1]|nr:unnamed protein product [Rotaria sp. Silwood1]